MTRYKTYVIEVHFKTEPKSQSWLQLLLVIAFVFWMRFMKFIILEKEVNILIYQKLSIELIIKRIPKIINKHNVLQKLIVFSKKLNSFLLKY